MWFRATHSLFMRAPGSFSTTRAPRLAGSAVSRRLMHSRPAHISTQAPLVRAWHSRTDLERAASGSALAHSWPLNLQQGMLPLAGECLITLHARPINHLEQWKISCSLDSRSARKKCRPRCRRSTLEVVGLAGADRAAGPELAVQGQVDHARQFVWVRRAAPPPL